MVQLLLAITLLLLLGYALLVSSPGVGSWFSSSKAHADGIYRAAQLTELAYNTSYRESNGTAPPVANTPDGGFAANFLPILKLSPYTPAGFEWVYGQQNNDGSAVAGLNYVCLRSSTESPASEHAYRALQVVKSVYAENEAYLGQECGGSNPEAASFPTAAALTIYFRPVPGVYK